MWLYIATLPQNFSINIRQLINFISLEYFTVTKLVEGNSVKPPIFERLVFDKIASIENWFTSLQLQNQEYCFIELRVILEISRCSF